MFPDLYLAVMVLLLGLSVGSFLNVVICRWPQMLEQAMRHDAELMLEQKTTPQKTFNLACPASHCPKCQQAITWWQNIPVLSYIMLRGRCYFCQTSISPRYLLVELFMGGLSVFLFWQFHLSFVFFALLSFACLLMVIICIDWEHQFLPDLLSYLLLWAGLLFNLHGYFTPLPQAVVGAVAGYLAFWLIYWVFKWVTQKEGLGYGDFKLLAALGAWLGVLKLPYIVLLASALTLLFLIFRYLFFKIELTKPIAYGPGLVVAGFILLVSQVAF